jgi:uncharacterized glyoxalase superfamily protein PhnB
MPQATVIPVLACPDVVAAAAWLCGAFGFTVRLGIGDHRIQLNVGEGGAVVLASAPAAARGASVMIRVEDVDAHHARAAAAGVRILEPPTSYPYGERQYSVEDPYGNQWKFSQSVEDVDPASWGASVGILG